MASKNMTFDEVVLEYAVARITRKRAGIHNIIILYTGAEKVAINSSGSYLLSSRTGRMLYFIYLVIICT